jgi:hypothetical protein
MLDTKVATLLSVLLTNGTFYGPGFATLLDGHFLIIGWIIKVSILSKLV